MEYTMIILNPSLFFQGVSQSSVDLMNISTAPSSRSSVKILNSTGSKREHLLHSTRYLAPGSLKKASSLEILVVCVGTSHTTGCALHLREHHSHCTQEDTGRTPLLS